MRKSILAIALLSSSVVVFAQTSGGATSNPNGVNITGNTEITAHAENVDALAKGQNNTARNAVGAIKGGTQIKGNTTINATARNVNATASGTNNTATNDVGTIGGK